MFCLSVAMIARSPSFFWGGGRGDIFGCVCKVDDVLRGLHL